VAHAGDSRAYLLDAAGFRQLTHDHTFVAEMVRAGEISAQNARGHHLRHYLTRSLGKGVIEPEVTTASWGAGCTLLLCSDGLTNMIDDHDIEQILLRCGSNLDQACEGLIDAANDAGGLDNIGVVVACP
jgi:protein phosphatase